MNEIKFFCIGCGASLSARAKSAGGFCDCPQCGRVTPIPEGPDGGAAGYSPDLLGIEIRFRCNCCGRKLRVDAHNQGQKFACPGCAGEAKVPEWRGPLPPVPVERPVAEKGVVVHLSAEECEYLSAPMMDAGNELRSA